MRETPMSNCEKEFILQAVFQKKRLDGRGPYDYRQMVIKFGVDRGCCHVHLGKTQVLAQVSCEVTSPKQARPSEGSVFVNVELSPIAAPQFEAGRQSDAGVELTRILERCIKESRCVDTESLCIMAGVKVWTVRLDIHVLNHNGNLIDAASVAAIAALVHFRRPDVTVSGEDVTIHTLEDRDPIPLSIHHMPICVTCAFFNKGNYLLVDPTDKEEQVMDGRVVVGMNKHREICTFQLTGSMLLLREQVLRCSNIAVVKVTEITALIDKAIQNDAQARASGEKFGFATSIETSKVTVKQAAPITIDSDSIEDEVEQVMQQSPPSPQQNIAVKLKGPGTGVLGEGGADSWAAEADWQMEEEADKDAELQQENEYKKMQQRQMQGSAKQSGVLGSDSEEENVVMLEQLDITASKKSERGKPSKGRQVDLTKAAKKGKSKPAKTKR